MICKLKKFGIICVLHAENFLNACRDSVICAVIIMVAQRSQELFLSPGHDFFGLPCQVTTGVTPAKWMKKNGCWWWECLLVYTKVARSHYPFIDTTILFRSWQVRMAPLQVTVSAWQLLCRSPYWKNNTKGQASIDTVDLYQAHATPIRCLITAYENNSSVHAVNGGWLPSLNFRFQCVFMRLWRFCINYLHWDGTLMGWLTLFHRRSSFLSIGTRP